MNPQAISVESIVASSELFRTTHGRTTSTRHASMNSRPQNSSELGAVVNAELGIEVEEVPFGLLIGSAWALFFTGIGALLVMSLLYVIR